MTSPFPHPLPVTSPCLAAVVWPGSCCSAADLFSARGFRAIFSRLTEHAGEANHIRILWSFSRTKDAWYADPRISLSADEVRDIENLTGLRYGREELASIETLIARADALLAGPDADFYGPFVAAFRAMARALDRTGTAE